MGMAHKTNGKQQVDVHYVNGPVPHIVDENLEGCYLDYVDFALAEVLQDQESVYESLQKNAQPDRARTSSSNDSQPNHSPGQSRRDGNPIVNLESQIAGDEAFARELQEWENQLAGTSLSHVTGREAGPSNVSGEQNSTNVSAQVSRQDDIDPDNMTYEDLESLGEAIGTQSRGLSDDLISFLPITKYKRGFFSRKDKDEECVICYMAYKNRDKLIVLACKHHYHSACITRWLKMNKACPVCNEEVFGP